MSKSEFDKLITDKFDQHEFTYNPASWDKLSHELGKGKTRPFPVPVARIAAIAASLAVMVAAATWMFNGQDEPATPAAVVSVPNKPVPEQAIPADPIVKETPAATPVAHQLNIPAPNNAIATTKSAKQLPARIQPLLPAVQETEAQHVPVVKNTNQQPTEVTDKPATPEVVFSPAIPPRNYDKELTFAPDVAKPQPGKTSISITGGLNYGSQNAGYTAGVNARQRLGKKIYLESDLAVVSNQATQSSLHPAEVDAFNTNTMAAKGSVETSEHNFLYLQLNPSVGYQLHRKLSVSVGGDMQKLLQANATDRALINESGEAMVLPSVDMGVTAKTEYSISRKLKAGLLYREGVNNMIYGSGNYLDRRYMQVQLKFSILNK